MRKIAGAFRTTPIAALEAELGLLPTDLRLDYQQRRYATRILTIPNEHPLLELCPNSFPKTQENDRDDPHPSTKLTSWWDTQTTNPRYTTRLDRILASINEYIEPPSLIENIDTTAHPPWYQNTLDIHINPASKEDAAAAHLEQHFYTHADSSQLCFYTDGSLLDQRAGSGITGSRAGEIIFERSYYLGQENETFDAELYAIAKAAATATRDVQTSEYNTSHIWIFSDNQAAVRRMCDKLPQPGQTHVLSALDHLTTLQNNGIKVHIHWVPGHVEVEGNERADILAKEGTTRAKPERDATTSITFIKKKIKERAMEEWKRRWQTAKRGRSYHGSPNKNIHPLLRNHPSRQLVSTTIQMRTGHSYTKAFLARIPTSTIDNPKCQCGYHTQTPKHLLLYCKLYNAERKTLKKAMHPLPLAWKTAMHTTKGIAATLDYLKDTGIATRQWLLGRHSEGTALTGTGWSHLNSAEGTTGGGDDETGERVMEMEEGEGEGQGVG